MTNTEFKNGFGINEVPWGIYIKQKKNQVFKLLPLKEENGEWQKQLQTILLEMGGIINLSPQEEVVAITIMAKLAGLENENDFMLYRKTVFEIISLLEDWKKERR
ncbi:hypothetical protein [Enterococcus faecium]|uniref:hypothetical protein n=1 Tax=Enterococcus faecium TaxID=1352 RepID=UPI00093D0BCE|nr:hypothetical protein [Enterococcus faecium]PHL10619.1 hypothetical protein CQR41_04490 [Enterococcus faecium]